MAILLEQARSVRGEGTSRILDEGPIGLAQVADRLRCCIPSVRRYIVRGTVGRDGNRVRLEAIRAGGKFLTSWAAVERYTTALTGAQPPPSPRSPGQKRRASDQAASELAALGIRVR